MPGRRLDGGAPPTAASSFCLYNMPGLGGVSLTAALGTYIFGGLEKCGELIGLAPMVRPLPGSSIARA